MSGTNGTDGCRAQDVDQSGVDASDHRAYRRIHIVGRIELNYRHNLRGVMLQYVNGGDVDHPSVVASTSPEMDTPYRPVHRTIHAMHLQRVG